MSTFQLKRYGKKSLWCHNMDNGDKEYFSYSTIVALFVSHENTLYLTNKKYSVTTSRHMGIIKREYQNTDVIIETVNL